MPTAPEIAQVATSARARPAGRGAGKLGVRRSKLEAERGRLGVDAVRAADRRRKLVLEGSTPKSIEQFVDVGDQNVRRTGELHVEAGVEDVGRGHARVHEARFRPDDLRHMGEECDHVVLDLALDRIDARDVEGRGPALLPDRRGGALRDRAERRHGVGRMRLDLEPDAKPGLRVPDGCHLGAGITRDHPGPR